MTQNLGFIPSWQFNYNAGPGDPSLRGLGAIDAGAQSAVAGFLASTPMPSSSQISDFLKIFPNSARADVAQALIAGGADPSAVASAGQFLAASSGLTLSTIWSALAVVSAAASGYHGYKRNQSIPWALWWFFAGGLFPVVTPVIALAQGFGKKSG